MLVSGDKKEVVERIASSLPIDEAYGGLKPEDKLQIVKKLQKEGKIVGMVGDGIVMKKMNQLDICF